eukprot:365607-Chlamydomonas_euryale.AAC.4
MQAMYKSVSVFRSEPLKNQVHAFHKGSGISGQAAKTCGIKQPMCSSMGAAKLTARNLRPSDSCEGRPSSSPSRQQSSGT